MSADLARFSLGLRFLSASAYGLFFGLVLFGALVFGFVDCEALDDEHAAPAFVEVR